jgi:hypothetical protein
MDDIQNSDSCINIYYHHKPIDVSYLFSFDKIRRAWKTTIIAVLMLLRVSVALGLELELELFT